MRAYVINGLACALIACFHPAANAQHDSSTIRFMRSVYSDWATPRAAQFVQRSDELFTQLQQACQRAEVAALPAAQRAWQSALGAWLALSTVPETPLPEWRVARQIDFAPTRVAHIQQAITQQPRGLAAMHRIGAAAKGFPALEWLLWQPGLVQDAARCAYAQEVVADVKGHAQTLHDKYRSELARPWKDDTADKRFNALVNQWIGSVERLRWQSIERPWQEAKSRQRAPEFARDISQSSVLDWQAQWRALRDFALTDPASSFMSLEGYLRRERQAPASLADAWRAQIMQVDAQMAALDTAQPATLEKAAQALAKLRAFFERQIAPALGVTLGFFDSDGD